MSKAGFEVDAKALEVELAEFVSVDGTRDLRPALVEIVRRYGPATPTAVAHLTAQWETPITRNDANQAFRLGEGAGVFQRLPLAPSAFTLVV